MRETANRVRVPGAVKGRAPEQQDLTAYLRTGTYYLCLSIFYPADFVMERTEVHDVCTLCASRVN